MQESEFPLPLHLSTKSMFPKYVCTIECSHSPPLILASCGVCASRASWTLPDPLARRCSEWQQRYPKTDAHASSTHGFVPAGKATKLKDIILAKYFPITNYTINSASNIVTLDMHLDELPAHSWA